MKKIITAILAGALLFNATNAAAYDWEESMLCGKATLSWHDSIDVPSHVLLEEAPLSTFAMKNCSEGMMGYLYVTMTVYPYAESAESGSIGLYADKYHNNLILSVTRRLSWTKKLGDTAYIYAELDRMKGGLTVHAVITAEGELAWASQKGKVATKMVQEYNAYINTGKGE